MLEQSSKSLKATGLSGPVRRAGVRLQVDPPVSSSTWTLVRGRVQLREAGRNGPRLGRSRRPSGSSDLSEAAIQARLPGEGRPREVHIGEGGHFESRFATNLPRPRVGRHTLYLKLRCLGEAIEQSMPLFMPRPGATLGIIVLAEDPNLLDAERRSSGSRRTGGIDLSRVNEELTAMLASQGGPNEQNPIFYLGFSERSSVGLPTQGRWPSGLWINAGIPAARGRAAAEHARWVSRLLELYKDELEMVIVADTGPHTLAVLKAIERNGASEGHVRAVCLSDVRPVARSVGRQSESPPGIGNLKLPIVVCKTIDDARRLGRELLGRPGDQSARQPTYATRRPRVVHHRVTRYPLVFCHGMVGYSALRLRHVDLSNYFVGLRKFLTDQGFRVIMPQLGRTHGVEQRAEQLRHAIGRWTREPVNIIAHSMGGLDARHLITHLDMDGRVVSLTTIATPHRGTYFADWFVERFDEKIPFLRGLEHLGADVDGFRDVTRAACHTFNLLTPDSPRVRYSSYSAFQVSRKIPAASRRSYAMITRAQGPNDGLVAVDSARWGEHIATLRADHCSLIGERGPESFDHLALYMRIIEDLIRLEF